MCKTCWFHLLGITVKKLMMAASVTVIKKEEQADQPIPPPLPTPLVKWQMGTDRSGFRRYKYLWRAAPSWVTVGEFEPGETGVSLFNRRVTRTSLQSWAKVQRRKRRFICHFNTNIWTVRSEKKTNMLFQIKFLSVILGSLRVTKISHSKSVAKRDKEEC